MKVCLNRQEEIDSVDFNTDHPIFFVDCLSENNEVIKAFIGIITNIIEDSPTHLVKVTDGGSVKLKAGIEDCAYGR